MKQKLNKTWKTANEGYCTIITRESQNKSATCVILKTILEKKKRAHLMSLAYYQLQRLERIKILVASWLAAKLPGDEMTGNPKDRDREYSNLGITIVMNTASNIRKYIVNFCQKLIDHSK